MEKFRKEIEEWLGSRREDGAAIAIDRKTTRRSKSEGHITGELPCFLTRMNDYGRIEKRKCRLLTGLSRLPRRQDWEGVQAVGVAASTVTS